MKTKQLNKIQLLYYLMMKLYVIVKIKIPSVYNCIYYKNNNDVFAIIKIKSNEDKPRFLLAYDDEYFEKDDIIYLVNYIFSN
jgi:hypothetical protein